MVSIIRNWLEQSVSYTPKFWTLVVCLSSSLLFVLFQGGKLALMVFIIVSLLTAYLGLGRWSGITKVKATRQLLNVEQGTALEAGSSASVQIQLQIPGIWPIPYVLLKDRLVRRGGGSYEFDGSVVPDWKRRANVEYLTVPLKRGFYYFERTECSTEDIFGLFEHKGAAAMPFSFSVSPKTVHVGEWPQLHRMIKGMHHHSTTTRALRETTQINGVREYIYGDRISRIHWNATARTGTWKSKEFERESLPKTIVMIDRNKSAYASEDDFELAVSIAASLQQYAQREDLAVGLLSVGADSRFFEPKRGAHQQNIISNHLIEVEADGRHSLLDVLKDRSRYFAQGSFFVMISPQKGDTMLQALTWVRSRQMNPCHVWIAGGSGSSAIDEWLKQLRSVDMMAYTVKHLEELQSVLGGRS
jgi:uncharacterized protein (DUF58 family)